MELLNVIRARSIWLFDSSELNPRGKSYTHELIEWLKDAYSFEKVPSSALDVDETKGLAFLDGHFQVRDEFFISVDVRIYTDGIVADTHSSTEETDLFVEDALRSIVTEFSLTRRSDLIRKKVYMNEVNVLMTKKLSNLNPSLNPIAQRISAALQVDGVCPFDFSGFTISPDPAFPLGLSPFKFERKLNSPFSENKYYSIAPLSTPSHLALLEEIEGILSLSA